MKQLLNENWALSSYQIARQFIAVTLSVLLIPAASGNLFAQDAPPPPYDQGPPPPQPYTPLDPLALDQLVAPIALYPDSLVAQVLTASTYPQQVSDADNWSQQNINLPPQQRADIANTMPWDPSIKSLTAFPSVLDNMARNYNWTASLGNAYYNQPGDVMNAVQAARLQAQQAGYLRSTPQQQVIYQDGLITIVPVNPSVVYVPYYDPWRVYGGWVRPYRGFYVAPPPPGVVIGVGLGFATVGIGIGLFAHYGWGWHSWEPNWRGGVVVYNHNTYISRSATVVNHGYFGRYNRGVYERGGAGVPANFRPPVTREGFDRRISAERAEHRDYNRSEPREFNRPEYNRQAPAPREYNRPAPAPGAYNRPEAPARGAYNRSEAPAARPAPEARPAPAPQPQREQNYQRPPAAAARPEGGNNRPPQGREARPIPQGRVAPQERGGEQRGHEERGREEHK